MPSMIKNRCHPGVFISHDKNYLYAFGGEESTIERLELNHRIDSDIMNSEWELLKV